jgi:hypothetical protein
MTGRLWDIHHNIKWFYLYNMTGCISSGLMWRYRWWSQQQPKYVRVVNYNIQLAGVPGVAQDDQWRNRIAILCLYNKEGGWNKLWKCIRVKYAPCYVRKSPQLTQKHTRARRGRQHREWIQCLVHTCKKKKAASWINTMSCSTINREAKTCNEIGMLPSVWNATEVLCFPLRSRNVNVCRVSNPRACNI